jgi:hypothetical protein
MVEASAKGKNGLKVPKGAKFAKQVIKFRNLRLKDLNPVRSFIPTDYKGSVFVDSVHTTGAQIIPGKSPFPKLPISPTTPENRFQRLMTRTDGRSCMAPHTAMVNYTC